MTSADHTEYNGVTYTAVVSMVLLERLGLRFPGVRAAPRPDHFVAQRVSSVVSPSSQLSNIKQASFRHRKTACR